VEDGPLSAPRPPLGIHQARVVEKGRLKLPQKFHHFLSAFNEPLYVTTLDAKVGRVYPIRAWQSTEQFLSQPGERAQAGARALFVANDYGEECQVDVQGRVLLPTNLRRDLNMEGQPVWLKWYRSHLDVYSQSVYEEKRREALATIEADVQSLDAGGCP
jgi:MraZ protein